MNPSPRPIKLSSFILIGVLSLSLLVCVPLLFITIQNERTKLIEHHDHFIEELISHRKALIKSDVQLVVNNIRFNQNMLADNISDEALASAKQALLDWVGNIRLRENQYVVVNTMDGTILAHYKKKNIGKNMWGFTDANGVKAVQEATKVSLLPEGGYVQYVGSIRPSTGKPGKKITYAKSIEDWGWVVSTGLYLDDVDIATAAHHQELDATLNEFFMQLGILLACSLLFAIVLSMILSRKLKENFSILLDLFSEDAQAPEGIDTPDHRASGHTESASSPTSRTLHFSEFRALADHVKQLLNQRRTLENQLRQSQRLEALGTMAGGMAHEFNNILASIMGYTELGMLKAGTNKAVTNCFESVLQASDRAAKLIKQLLSFARQSEKVEFGLFNPVKVIHEAVKMSRSVLPSRIKIDTRIHDTELCIRGDSTQLYQVIINLITNASQAIDEESDGQIIVSARASNAADIQTEGRASLALEQARYLQITVEDSGCGIEEQSLTKIFEPFYTTKEIGKGTGLGLSLVMGIVKDHHGEIWVDSDGNQGTCFTILFPLEQHLSPLPSQQDTVTSTSIDGTVLIAEDDELLGQMYRESLRTLGLKVELYTNGADALAAFQSNPEAYDLLLTDMEMPKLSGKQLAMAILAQKPDFPIMITSGFSEQMSKEIASALGIRLFLAKPVDRTTLSQSIQDLLDSAS